MTVINVKKILYIVKYMTNKKLVDMLKSYALSDADLQYILNPDTKIHTYDQLYNINHFDELLDSLGRCIILYLTENGKTGHWISVIKKGNTVEFFDPYGYFPDTQGHNLNTPDEINKEFGQDKPRLLELIYKAGYNLEYNNKPVQKERMDIATCGRHTASRLLFYKLSLDQYHDLMNKLKDEQNKDADDVVVNLTYEILKK